jgi:serine/threonine-protein phosphatase PGAM5
MASRFARHVFPAAAATVFSSSSFFSNRSTKTTSCDANAASNPLQNGVKAAGMDSSEKGDFHGLFPRRQLWKPKVEYPLWDADWDGLDPISTGDKEEDRRRKRKLRKEGVTRHVILIRHGQYTEQEKLDENRILTPLGRQQADLTGRRLKEMIEGVAGTGFTGCNIKVVRVSNMARAKETADIIAAHFPGAERAEPDPDLNEGRPSHNVPGSASASTVEKTDESHPRIEAAFRKYFYREHQIPTEEQSGGDSDSNEINQVDPNSGEQKEGKQHEFEIIVCHANVIRYFLCRALQIPPEAWLRLCTFNCSLTYLTIRPTGTVSCRMLGGKYCNITLNRATQQNSTSPSFNTLFFLFVGQSLSYLRYRALTLRNEYIFHASRFQLVTECFWLFKILILKTFRRLPFLKMLCSWHDLSLQQLLLKWTGMATEHLLRVSSFVDP